MLSIMIMVTIVIISIIIINVSMITIIIWHREAPRHARQRDVTGPDWRRYVYIYIYIYLYV